MDGSEIQFLGTGTAYNQDGRGCQSILIRPSAAGEFLVDVGPTALAAIEGQRVSTERLDRLFVTHLHGDHVGGWPFLVLRMALMEPRSRPFEVIGPEGCREALEGLLRHTAYDDLVSGKFEIAYRELAVEPANDLAIDDGLSVDVFPMEHHPSSIAYRFRLGDLRVAVSGDTGWCNNLEELARGSDLLILECSSVEPQPVTHLSLAELREKIDRLEAERLVLVHLPDRVASALARDPLARVEAAHDGLVLGL